MLITSGGQTDWRKSFFDLKVLLDGVEQYNVTEADDEAGYLIRLILDESGWPVRKIYHNYYKTERVTGVVQFIGQRRVNDADRKARAEAKRAGRRSRNLSVANGRAD